MRTLSLVLILAGFIIPFGAALVAYRRVGRVYQSQGIRGVWPSYPKFTWDDFDNLGGILSYTHGLQVEAVKWPAVWALLGLACATIGSGLALYLP